MKLDVNKYGTYTISDKAINDIVGIAVKNIKNVYLPKKEKDFVVSKFNKNNELNINVAVRIKKGIDLVKLCSKIQDEICENVILMLGIEPKKVNIDIQGFETVK